LIEARDAYIATHVIQDLMSRGASEHDAQLLVESWRRGYIEAGHAAVPATLTACRQRQQEAYVPLAFAPGERAEFDFGHAVVVLGGTRVELPFLAGRLRYLGAMYVECFPTERQDCFLIRAASCLRVLGRGRQDGGLR
jgi:hypothetical protein